MIQVKGKYNEATIFSERYDDNAYSQILELCNQKAFQKANIKIMPDYHSGSGCVIGFTAKLNKKTIIPNIIGVDISCGVRVVDLGTIGINYEKLDAFIKKNIPARFETYNSPQEKFSDLEKLTCFDKLIDLEWIENSLGTLGGGNHFIEIDVDENQNKWLVIHTGSRNLGKQVCDIHQNIAVETMSDLRKRKIKEVLKTIPERDREKELLAIKEKYSVAKTGLEVLTGKNADNYIHDMLICANWAKKNREIIANKILKYLGIDNAPYFESVHNYVEISGDEIIIRKGAISAKKGEQCIIPLNMRDGSALCIGKGNAEWNESAPHGAGRLMSRSVAKANIDLEAFRQSMKGIYSTSVNSSTLDESPMAYKPFEEILSQIEDTVDVIKVIKPIYNFKAGE